MRQTLKELWISVVATLAFAILVSGAYPVAVWGLAQVFSRQAAGSLVVKDGKVVGSELIGQNFTSDRYFNSRPSAAGNGYEADNSGGTNLGPLSKKLLDSVKDAAADYRKKNGLKEDAPVPADAVLSSSSGLDPHISVANALLQAPRVARVRGIREELVRHFIEQHTEGRDWGFLGEPRVNVFRLNLTLDEYPAHPAK
ncbi:MAG TPA: K(+)-transporting ATPase subunit C [Planctomycetota bacterium]|nr:K(+)-transporting ATPase subunit C [Planctomycetota bacterium]